MCTTGMIVNIIGPLAMIGFCVVIVLIARELW